MKKLLAFILAAILLVSLVSCKKDVEDDDSGIQDAAEESFYTDATTGDKLYYEVDELGGYAIVKFESKSSSAHKVVIPSEIDSVEVTGVAAHAFLGSSYISEVEIPASVEYVGDFAFSGSIYLTKVTMTDSVTKLGKGIFKDCIALTEAKLTTSIERLPDFTFENCKALASYTIPEKVTAIGSGAFMGSGLANVVIPASVKTIEDGAFIQNINLLKITIPATVETIGNQVFDTIPATTTEEDVDVKASFIIVGAEGSAAQKYAEEYDYTFEVLA